MKRDHEAARNREIEQLRQQVTLLQRERLLNDPLATGVRGDAIAEYLHALTDLVIERGAPGSRIEGGSRPTGYDSTGRPSPVPAWADELLQRELRWLRRRTEWLHDWLLRPREVRQKAAHKCSRCHAGLPRGARFCGRCGAPTSHKEAP